MRLTRTSTRTHTRTHRRTTHTRHIRAVVAASLLVGAASCGSSKAGTAGSSGGGSALTGCVKNTGQSITLAVNPWAGSAVNANVAKLVIECKIGTTVNLTDIDENASWPGLDDGSIDANLEIWPSGHAKDRATYIDEKKTVEDIGLLGPNAKIGWYVPSFVTDADPKLKSWEAFKDPAEAKKFATAETGDKGRFLMGDASYVTYDEQIIANLQLPLKFTVAGSEAALITAIQKAVKDKKPLLLQFWQPQWLHSKVKLTEIKLPDFTDACAASAEAKDGKYACDYPIDKLYKAASVKLATKNPAVLAFLKKFQVTNDQQNEIAGLVNGDIKQAPKAASTWLAKHGDVVKAWLG